MNPAIEFFPSPTGRGFRLSCELLVPRPREEVFAFFSDAFALEQLTPPQLKFRVATPRPIEIGEGTQIDYRLKVRGIPMRWRSLIRDWNPPFRFIDEQLIGPYRWWHHEHTFEETPEGTLVRDVVDYGVPGGRLINAWLVRPDLRRIFEFRREQLLEKFGDARTLAVRGREKSKLPN